MRLTVHEFISLDGVIQGPGGAEEDRSGGFDKGGWLVPHSGDGQLSPVEGWFRKADALLLGRRTFELMRSYWPQVTDPDNVVATVLNGWPKFVASTTLSDGDAAWGNTTVLRADVIEQVRRLKEERDGELQVHGSYQLVRALHDAGLVDTYRLLQVPVVVGDGKKLFDRGTAPAGYTITGIEHLNVGAGAISIELEHVAVQQSNRDSFVVRDGKEALSA